MVTRKTGCGSWHWLGNIQAVGWMWTLLVGLCSGMQLRAADFVLPLSPASASNTTTVMLGYQETDYPIANWNVLLMTQTVPFENEPVTVPGKVVRGVLTFRGDASNSIRFIWQRDAGKLFLDLNRDQEFTNHPANIFLARGTNPIHYQTFTNLHLPLHTAAGKIQMLVDLNFWDYSSRSSCSLAVRSFWQGRVTLHGRDWQAGVIENSSGQRGSLASSDLLLRPWEKRNQAFSANGAVPDAWPFTPKIFVDGHAYKLALTNTSTAALVAPRLQFTEQGVALGELKVTGKFIQHLVLSGGPYLVMLDRPAAVEKIPTGSYNQFQVRLEHDGTAAFCGFSQPSGARQISVNDQTPAVLNIGGPLTNAVTASRHGQDLRLDYRLVGAGGETYKLVNEDRSHPPEFAVYKGDKQIASGKFEFG